jgi:hypothetical protein
VPIVALGNDIVRNHTFHQTTQPHTASNKNGEKPEIPPAIDSVQNTYYLRSNIWPWWTGPDLRYDYPPMLETLVQLGFLHKYDKGVFMCIREPQLQRKASSLGSTSSYARFALRLGECFLQIIDSTGKVDLVLWNG